MEKLQRVVETVKNDYDHLAWGWQLVLYIEETTFRDKEKFYLIVTPPLGGIGSGTVFIGNGSDENPETRNIITVFSSKDFLFYPGSVKADVLYICTYYAKGLSSVGSAVIMKLPTDEPEDDPEDDPTEDIPEYKCCRCCRRCYCNYLIKKRCNCRQCIKKRHRCCKCGRETNHQLTDI